VTSPSQYLALAWRVASAALVLPPTRRSVGGPIRSLAWRTDHREAGGRGL